MARTIGIGSIVTGVFIGSMLVLAACGCRSANPPASGVQTAPEAAAAATPQNATGSQGVQPPVAGDQTRRTRGSEGKPDESKPPVDLSLRFSPGSTATYRAILEQERTVTWQGDESAKPPQFKDGRSGTRIEVTFGQTVESVDTDGSAVVRIAIEGLKYAGAVRNNVPLEFDSQAVGDPNRPLAKLIGRSYRIKLSRRAEVLEVVDAGQARSAVAGDSPEQQVARKLLSDEEIRDRHAVAAMVALKDTQVRPGQQWSSVKGFSFGWMGSKSFERVYTLSGTAAKDGRQVAVVEMKAIPSAAMAEQRPQASGFGQMFDSTDNYNGRFELDLGSGQVREYIEQMRSEWIVADPQTMQGGSKPAALRMTAMRLNRLELVK